MNREPAVRGSAAVGGPSSSLPGSKPHPNDRPSVGRVFERPELDEFCLLHAAIGPAGQGRIVIDHLARLGVVAKDEPKMLGRARAVVEVHADDRRDSLDEIGMHRGEARFQLLVGRFDGDSLPRRADAKADRGQHPDHVFRIAAAAFERVELRLIEDIILIELLAELPQGHLGAGFAAEIGLLTDERDTFDPHRGIIGRRVKRAPAARPNETIPTTPRTVHFVNRNMRRSPLAVSIPLPCRPLAPLWRLRKAS